MATLRISKAAGASPVNGGGEHFGVNDGPIYTSANTSLNAGNNQITDNVGAWAGCAIGDCFCFNPPAPQYSRITNIAGNVITILPLMAGGPIVNKTTNVGGAWLNPNTATPLVQAGDHVYIRGNGDTYNVQDGVSGGILCVRVTGTNAAPIVWDGYKETPGDAEGHWDEDDYRPLFAPGVLANGVVAGLAAANRYQFFKHIRVDQGTSHGFHLLSIRSTVCVDCEAYDCGGYGFYGDYSCRYVGCEASECANYGFYLRYYCAAVFCFAHHNAWRGFDVGAASCCLIGCLATNNLDGQYSLRAANTLVVNCSADGYGIDYGFKLESYGEILVNSISFNTTTGVICLADRDHLHLLINMLINTWSVARTSNNPIEIDSVAGDPDPQFVDPATYDYRLKMNSPALGRGNIDPLQVPGAIDLGAAQRKPSLALPWRSQVIE